MVSTILTSIFTEDELDFSKFLQERGFSDFYLFPSKIENVYLSIEFENEASLFRYKLRAIEEEYKGIRSNKYYYDLDEAFDTEAEEFFNDDDRNPN